MFDMRIAGLDIRVKNRYPFVERQCRDWVVPEAFAEPDMIVEITEEELEGERHTSSGSFSAGYCESICVYRAIARKLYLYDAFVFHASVIRVDEEGYAFAAKSGVGKSTHTRYWLETFKERACVINGDKPIIRYIDGRFYAFGTPWQGKEGWGVNESVPLRACAFLMRGKENRIRQADSSEIVMRLFRQVLMPEEELEMNIFMDIMERFMQEVSFYLLECTMEQKAAEVAYEGMASEQKA